MMRSGRRIAPRNDELKYQRDRVCAAGASACVWVFVFGNSPPYVKNSQHTAPAQYRSHTATATAAATTKNSDSTDINNNKKNQPAGTDIPIC